MTKKFGQNEKQVKGKQVKEQLLASKRERAKELKENEESELWKIGAQDYSKRELEKIKREEKLAKKKERENLLERETTLLIDKPSNIKATIAQETAPTILASSSFKESDAQTELSYSASNIDDALELLTTLASKPTAVVSSIERHPERRVKAAFLAFEEKELPQLKKEYPFLRLSQLKEILKKKFSKSDENPLNQPHVSYDLSPDDVKELTKKIQDTKLESFKTIH